AALLFAIGLKSGGGTGQRHSRFPGRTSRCSRRGQHSGFPRCKAIAAGPAAERGRSAREAEERRAVMSVFPRVVQRRLSSERFDVRLGRLLCFAAGPALLVVALVGLGRLALTPGEAFIGVLASVAVALLLVILGIVLPLAAQAPPNHTLHPAG